MGSAIGLREDFCAVDLRRLARATKDAVQSRRLLGLAEIYDGCARSDAARIGGWVGRRFATGCCASMGEDRAGL